MAKKLLMTSAALISLVAMALPAIALASPEIGETSGGVFTKLATGVAIRGTSVGVIKMTDINANVLVECARAQIDGTLNTNSGTELNITIDTATFAGTGANGACTGFFGSKDVEVTTKVGNGVPWCFAAGGKLGADVFSLRGNNCASASRSITFVLDTTFGQCKYERAAAASGTFTTDVSGQIGEFTASKQEFPAEAGNPFGCPAVWYLDMTFKLETTNGTALYIK